MKKRFLWIVAIFCIGGFGGIVLERTLIPWLAAQDAFRSFPRLTLDRVTVVQPKEEIIIDRAQEVEKVVEAAQQGVVVAVRQSASGGMVGSASGLTLTTDGIIVVPFSVVQGKGSLVVRQNGTVFPATVMRTDEQLGLALLKVEASGFSVPSFAEVPDIHLGSSVVRIRAILTAQGIVDHEVSAGIVTRTKEDGTFSTDLAVGEESLGAALFTSSEKLAGVQGTAGIVWAPQIKTFFESQ